MRSHDRVKCCPDRQKRPKLFYYLHLPSLQNGLIKYFNVSRLFISLTNILFTIQFILIVPQFNYQIMIFARHRAELFDQTKRS